LTYREENGETIVPLYLGPEESQFIIFRKNKKTSHIVAIEKDGKKLFPGNELKGDDKRYISIIKTGGKLFSEIYEPGNYKMTWSDGKTWTSVLKSKNHEQPISGGWEINFDTTWGGPAKIMTDSLKSWIAFNDAGIKYYSGAALYKKTFVVKQDLLKESKVILDLGNVLEMGAITINGNKLPIKWSAPFSFDITAYVKPGNNNLEEEVVNLWPNRLIGDSKLPAEKRLTKTNVVKFEDAESGKLLRESGLLGPVKLIFIHYNSGKIYE
jgi:hypothetical protein